MKVTGDTQLIQAIFSFSRSFKGQMCYDGGFLHLSLLQIQTLLFLEQNPEVQMRDIATHFSIEMPTATNLISKLVRERLVARKQDSEDRRLVRIALTTKGKKLLQDAMKQRDYKLSVLLSFLSQKDKESLLRIITQLNATMEKIA